MWNEPQPSFQLDLRETSPMLSFQAQAQLFMEMQLRFDETKHSVCIKRCVSTPDGRLTDKQKRCLDNCVGAFKEGFGVAVS